MRKYLRHILPGAAIFLLLALTAISAWRQNRLHSKRTALQNPDVYDEQAAMVESMAEKFLDDLDLAAVLDPQGGIYRILCPDDTLEQLFTDYLPSYEPQETLGRELRSRIQTKTGKIGELTVIWTIFRDTEEAYMDYLDELLVEQDSKAEADRLDLFVIKSEQLSKYCGTEVPVAMTMDELGIVDGYLAGQYSSLRSLSALYNGEQRAVTWELPCLVWLYNRKIAEEVLGTDDPNAVSAAIADWDTFHETAARMREAGYRMYSSFTETYAPHLPSVTRSWINSENAIVFDDAVVDWIHKTKDEYDAGSVTGTIRRSDEWKHELRSADDIFGFFVTPHEIHSLIGEREDLAVAAGPGSYPSDASWLCGAVGSDNRLLTADLMKQLTTDTEIMRAIFKGTGEPVNNRYVMQETYSAEIIETEEQQSADLQSDISPDRSEEEPIAEESEAQAAFRKLLGGQNPYRIFHEVSAECELPYITVYDRRLGDLLAESYIPYFKGETDEASALHAFYQNAQIAYPDLTG
ncbi:MAG: hypothetical protein Q4B09_03140 [Lachnospiraceae bacterium]|nr:hypothetical protein [Lachnospiraceae bacterium]